MQINIANIWTSVVELQHSEFLGKIISLNFPPKNPIMNQLLLRYADKLALSRPKELRLIIKDIEHLKRAAPKKIRLEFEDDCKKLFDYGRFSTKGATHWNAYSLCMKSGYRLCPYCQQSLAVTVYRDRKSKALRPTLDHFYPKHKYPYLALSLYNLIPSCHPCNSSLKGKIDFYKQQHLHPYEDQEIIQYDWDIDSYIKHRSTATNADQPKVVIRNIAPNHLLYQQAQRSIATFLTKERLILSQSEISRFIETLLFYSEERLDEVNRSIFESFSLNLSKESALNFSRADYKNEWLGAIKRDLYDIGWSR
jgi:hypothetical protein